jgi:hypothetical protein
MRVTRGITLPQDYASAAGSFKLPAGAAALKERWTGWAMLPPPAGIWGMPVDFLVTVPGYDPDIAKYRAEAREIMAKLGYSAEKHLAIKVSARQHPDLSRSRGDPH